MHEIPVESVDDSNSRRLRVIAEFREYAPVHSQLPVEVANGGTINEFRATCGACGGDIEPNNFRGVFGKMSDDGPLLLSAHLFCRVCNSYTPYAHRVRGRGGKLTSEYQNEQGQWVWSEWKTPVGGIVRLNIASFLERFFH